MNENEPLLFTVSLCLQLSSQMFLLNVKVPVKIYVSIETTHGAELGEK